MKSSIFTGPLLAIAVVAATFLSPPAMAAGLSNGAPLASTSKAETPDAKKPKKAKKASSGSTKFKILPGGSGETAAERSNRLKRECKGRVNAGACEGYTS